MRANFALKQVKNEVKCLTDNNEYYSITVMKLFEITEVYSPLARGGCQTMMGGGLSLIHI